jgi:succinate-acetate transporter protein
MANTNIADPAPLGLAAFGLTTIMLSSANAGLWHGAGAGAAIAAALFYGGLTQLLAGMWEFMRGNTFGATAFSSFGAFWLAVWYGITQKSFGPGSVGVFMLCFAIATFVLWLAAIKHNMHLNLLFLALFITFVFLAYGNWGAMGHSGAVKVGGWTGLVTAAIALYIAAKTLINESWGRTVLP